MIFSVKKKNSMNTYPECQKVLFIFSNLLNTFENNVIAKKSPQEFLLKS